MNQLEFNRAMSYIDDDIVDGFLENKIKLQNKIKFQRKSPQFLKWGAVAAVFCLIFAAMFIIAKKANEGANLPEPEIDGIIGNITEDTTEKVNEDTTDVGEEDTSDIVIDQLGLPAPIDEIIWGNPDNSGVSSESFGTVWNGIVVDDELYEMLNEESEDKYIAISVWYYGEDDIDANAILRDLLKNYCVIERNGAVYAFVTKTELLNFDANALEDYKICFAKKSAFLGVSDIPKISDDIFVTDVVHGFDYDKITFFDITDGEPESDEKVISMLNETIEKWKYTYNSLVFTLYCKADLSDRDYTNMNYYDLYIDNYRGEFPTIIIKVKYEDINAEALRDISNIDEITSIWVTVPHEAVSD